MFLRAPLIVPILLLLAAACPKTGGAGSGEPASEPPELRIAGELTLRDGVLRHMADGAELASWPLGEGHSALPYKLVASAPPGIATTIDAELNATTWALAPQLLAYQGMLPLIVEERTIALVPLTVKPAGGAEGLTLLKPDGGVAWSDDNADLLWPATGFNGVRVYALQAGADADAIYPFGERPTLVSIDPTSGTEDWRMPLDAPARVADAQIWAIGDAAILASLQYDYEVFEFFIIDLRSGEVRKRFDLRGKPASQAVYPGPQALPTGAGITGSTAHVRVATDTGWQEWSFDLAQGSLAKVSAEPPASATEENELPEGGEGVPGPGSEPFPQRLLPAESGGAWTIPAVVNRIGQVLVVIDGIAEWR